MPCALPSKGVLQKPGKALGYVLPPVVLGWGRLLMLKVETVVLVPSLGTLRGAGTSFPSAGALAGQAAALVLLPRWPGGVC